MIAAAFVQKLQLKDLDVHLMKPGRTFTTRTTKRLVKIATSARSTTTGASPATLTRTNPWMRTSALPGTKETGVGETPRRCTLRARLMTAATDSVRGIALKVSAQQTRTFVSRVANVTPILMDLMELVSAHVVVVVMMMELMKVIMTEEGKNIKSAPHINSVASRDSVEESATLEREPATASTTFVNRVSSVWSGMKVLQVGNAL